MLNLVVPEGFSPGTSFPVQSPDGLLHALVPPNVTTGQSFTAISPMRLGAEICALRPPERQRAMTRGVRKGSLVAGHSESSALTEDHYREIRELGRGAFGRAVLVKDERMGHECVKKVVDIKGQDPIAVDLMLNEIESMRKLEHPCIVGIHEFATDLVKEEIVMILEYIDGGSMQDMLKTGPLPETFITVLLHQLLSALAFCHGRGIAHRDIKPDNIMVTRGAHDDPPWVCCKLIDFGLAGAAQMFVVPFGCAPEPVVQGCLGTKEYMPPEVIDFQPYTTKADLWSTGVTVVQLMTCRLLFSDESRDNEAIFRKIRRYAGPAELDVMLGPAPEWGSCTEEARSFAGILLEVDPRQRPTALAALGTSWLRAHEREPQLLSQKVVASCASYLQAHAVARCCLLVVATRLGLGTTAEREELGRMFLAADVDRDGKVSREDLAAALKAEGSPLAESVDVEGLIAAANISHSGCLSYTEFSAVCLHDQLGSLDELLRRTFHALDTDRDGDIDIEDVRPCFRERDAPLLESLPQGRPLSLEDWCHGVRRWVDSQGS